VVKQTLGEETPNLKLLEDDGEVYGSADAEALGVRVDLQVPGDTAGGNRRLALDDWEFGSLGHGLRVEGLRIFPTAAGRGHIQIATKGGHVDTVVAASPERWPESVRL
jgi:hypothetical protein